jgi:hypothetical protein
MLFYVGVYRDQLAAMQTITNLRHYYPQATVFSISDGVTDETYSNFCGLTHVSYAVGTRLKLPAFRGAWTNRFLKVFLASNHDVCVKVDPDTVVTRATEFPDAPIFSAWRDSSLGKRALAGPAIGFSRLAAQQIVDSGLLFDPKYAGAEYSYRRFGPRFLKPGETPSDEAVSLQDEITTDVVERLGIIPLQWDAVSLTDLAAPFYHRP